MRHIFALVFLERQLKRYGNPSMDSVVLLLSNGKPLRNP
jgi:hypothetical protein